MAEDLIAVIRALEDSRSPASTLNAPQGPGVYAFYLKEEAALRPFRARCNGVIYVGRSSNLAAREWDHHFNSEKTGFSTLRRSIGAILKSELGLVALPRSGGRSKTNVRNYRFAPEGEARLTGWMQRHLELGVHATGGSVKRLEEQLIAELQPLLNLTGWPNSDRATLKRLRKICADEACSQHKSLTGGAAQKPRPLPFGAIRDRLDTLAVALTNLLDRGFPQDLGFIAGLQPFLLVTMKAVTNIFETIRYVAADLPEDPSRKLEFGLALGPVVRSLADILFTLVFMREDLPARVSRYHRGGWRELKEDFERHQSEYGSLPEWQGWFSKYQAGLEHLRVNYGISEAEAANPSTLPYWPTPGQMVRRGEAAEETKKFLQFLEDWVYRGLSADAHMSAAGIVRRHGFLLLTKDEGREEILGKLKSDSVFTAATLVVAICSEVNSVCRYGQEEKLSYLWRMLVEYWGEAKDLFERRYSGMVAPSC